MRLSLYKVNSLDHAFGLRDPFEKAQHLVVGPPILFS